MAAVQNEEHRKFTFQEYLIWEERNEEKHEFFDGSVYAMAGASDSHDLVTGNIFGELRQHLKGGPCRAYTADMKLKIQLQHADACYYPDTMVICDASDDHHSYKTKPQLIVEVLSNARRDKLEKLFMYQQIESLQEYLIIGQDLEKPEAWIYRRDNEWQPEVVSSGESIVVPSLNFEISLTSLYES